MTTYSPSYNELLVELDNLRRRVAELEAAATDRPLFETVFRANPDAIALVRLRDGLCVDVNDQFLRISGYAYEEVVGQTDTALGLWVDIEQRSRFETGLRQGGLIESVPAQFRTKTGVPVTGLVSASTISVAGEAHVLAVIKDITVWQEAGLELRRQNRRLELLNRIVLAVAGSAEPDYVLDVACRELAWAFQVPRVMAMMFSSDRATAVVSAEFQAGRVSGRLGQVVPLADDPTAQYLLRNKVPLVISEGQRDPRLADIRAWLKRRRVASLLLTPLAIDDDVVGSLCLEAFEPRQFSSDEITLAWSVADQVSGAVARAQLNARLQLLSAAIDQAADIIAIADSEGIIRYINPAYERITGFRRTEAVGRSLMVLHNEENSAVPDSLWSTIRSGEVWRAHITRNKRDGTPYTVDTSVTPIKNSDGQIVNFVSSQRDVTRELELEVRFRQAQKMEAIGQLTAGIAHDFNNLLMAMNGFAELLTVQLPPDSPFRHMASRIVDSGESAASLIRQLLIFSRKQVTEPQVLNLNRAVTEVDKMLRRIIGEHIELRLRLASDLWPIEIDRTQLEQVVVNIAVNARDAMPDGGQLLIATKNIRLEGGEQGELPQLPAGDYVCLSISDTGIGMTEQTRQRIFEPFFTTKPQGEGSGLGLATVDGIVQQVGGSIQVDSTLREGSIFRLYLPRAVQPELAASDRSEASDSYGGNETVLLVEDNPAVQELVSLTLQWYGYNVITAGNGREALEILALRPQHIDLLLTDVVMPQMNGKELAEQLITHKPMLKVIFTSGYTRQAIAHYNIPKPGITFLQKPFSPHTLVSTVRQVLDSPA
jgi:PAS domain S-box-containing protein